MTATQPPKPGDRFRWRGGVGLHATVAVTEHFVHYESESRTAAYPPALLDYWLANAIPIPPKPHVEPMQWGNVTRDGSYIYVSTEAHARDYADDHSGTLAKLDHGVLFVEVNGEWVRAFDESDLPQQMADAVIRNLDPRGMR